MLFFDTVTVRCTSGAGGDGCVAARREKYVPYGGPAGGNGGKGGSIILRATSQLSTLGPLHARKHIKAPAGESGKIKEQYGKDADDVIVDVPCGTIVRDAETHAVLCSLGHEGEMIVLLTGGKGGIGNMHFKSSVMQYANFGLLGEPGQSKLFAFELQLVADVALLGFPSVGKTSLLNTVSAAAAKTADYPFTTLIPNLGVVTEATPPFVLIDIPGLIEGAAQGKGLGNEFLRHVMKARIWSFVIDVTTYEEGIAQLLQLFDELATYLATMVYADHTIEQSLTVDKQLLVWRVSDTYDNHLLAEKKLCFVLNKADLLHDADIRTELVHALTDAVVASRWTVGLKKNVVRAHCFMVSAGSKEGIRGWIDRCSNVLEQMRGGDESVPEVQEILEDAVPMKKYRTRRREIEGLVVRDCTTERGQWLVDHEYIEDKALKYLCVWEVSHPTINYLSYVLPRGNDEAELRYRRTLEKEKLLSALERAGVRRGDIFFIKSPYAGKEDRWIKWE